MDDTKSKVRIGVIDSGVDSTHPDFKDIRIVQYSVKNNLIQPDTYPTDVFGHGTACAGIIHKIDPKAEIISIRCLDSGAQTDGDHVLAAIEWCISQRIDIINLSMGALSSSKQDLFSVLGEKAKKYNILIFTSCNDSGHQTIPACLPYYIPVVGKTVRGKNTYYYQDGIFFAHGGMQRVDWISPRHIISQGSSFATAHMSAFASKIKRNSGLKKYDDLLNAIIQCSTNKTIELTSISKNTVVDSNSQPFRITNAAIVSFTKEIHSLLRFPDLTKINISSITDLPFKQRNDSEIKELCSAVDIQPFSNLEQNLENPEVDTVIISRTSKYEALTQHDCLTKILEKAIYHRKNVYSLEYLDNHMYPELYEMAKEYNCAIRHPMLSYDNLNLALYYRNLYGHLGTDTPVLGVFGTGTSQGKFTVQLMLRRLFLSKGYRVNSYGTETCSELLGFEGFYPLEMDLSVKFSSLDMIPFIQGDIRRLEICNSPDIIIVGAQSGTIPHSYSIQSSEYTLPTLAFLMATLPHAYILTINPFDDIDYISDTIKVIEGIGKSPVIAIACSRHTRIINADQVVNYDVSLSEYTRIKDRIMQSLGLKVYDVLDSSEANDLFSLIISFFS